VTLYPEYTGIMLSVTFKKKTLPKSDIGTYLAAKALYEHAGFVAWGVERAAIVVDGTPYDKVYMTKWLANQKPGLGVRD